MTKVFFLIFPFIFLIFDSVLAHVCDDVLRDDPITVWPEKEIIEITKTGQFRIFLENNYSESINQVRLIVPQSPFDVSVSPTLIEKVRPGEKISFLIELTIPEKTKPGDYPLLIKINAQEFGVTRDVDLTIKVKEPPQPKNRVKKPLPLPVNRVEEPSSPSELRPKPEAMIKVVPKEILVATTAFPEEIDIEPGKEVVFKAFVRSGYTQPLHHLFLSIKPIEKFEIEVTPKIIEKLEPGATKFFVVRLKIPSEIKEGEYLLQINFKANEFPIERHFDDVLIRVSKVKDWRIYFYLLATFLIIFILIWRWWKLSQRRSKLHLRQ